MTPEFFLAILSLARLIDAKTFKVSKSDITTALQLEATLRSEIRQLLKGESLPALEPLSFSDIDAIQEDLHSLDMEHELQGLLPQLDQNGLDMGIGATWASLLTSLQDMLPRDSIIDTGFKLSDAPGSSRSLRSKFLWAARLADSPRWILRLFEKQQLSDFDVKVLIEFYPELYEHMATLFIEEVINLFSVSDTLPRKLKLMLSIFLQTPVLNVETTQAYKAGETAQSESTPIKPTASPDINLSASAPGEK